MALYREQGIILRTYKLGETDRIVHALTSGRGKVRAVAKGVRKPTSKFGGRLEPFSHVDLQLYEGRSLDIVTQAELITPFHAVRADYVLSACGSTMVEAADRVGQEGERNNRLFLLLLDGMRALDDHPDNPALLLDAFLFRLASVAGYHPYLQACAGCGQAGRHRVFGLDAGGVLCPACAPPAATLLDEAVIDLLHLLEGGDWDALAGGATERGTRRTVAALVNSFLTYHLGKPLRAWDLVPR